MFLIRKGRKPQAICRQHLLAFRGKRCPKCSKSTVERRHAIRVYRELLKAVRVS